MSSYTQKKHVRRQRKIIKTITKYCKPLNNINNNQEEEDTVKFFLLERKIIGFENKLYIACINIFS